MYGCPDDPVAKCNNDGECLPGFICEQNICIAGNRGGVTVGICPEGGMVVSPEGASLEVPEGAVSECVRITLRKASAGLNALEVTELGDFWVLTPEGTTFAKAATIRVAVDTSDVRAGEMISVWQSQSPTGPYSMLDSTLTASVASGQTMGLGLFVPGVPRRPEADSGPLADAGLHPDAVADGGILDADGGFPLVDIGPRQMDAARIDPDLGTEVVDMGPRTDDAGDDRMTDADSIPPIPDTGMMMGIVDSGTGAIPDTGMGMPDSGLGGMEDTGMGTADSGMGGGMVDTWMGMPDSGSGGMSDSGMGMPDSGFGGGMSDSGMGVPDLGFGGGGMDTGAIPDTGMGGIGDTGSGGFTDSGMGMGDTGIGGLPDSGMNFDDGGGLGDSGMSGFDEAGIGIPDSGMMGGGQPGGDM